MLYRWSASFGDAKVAQNHKACAPICERSWADDLGQLESRTLDTLIESCALTDQLFSCTHTSGTISEIEEISRLIRDFKRRAKLISEGAQDDPDDEDSDEEQLEACV